MSKGTAGLEKLKPPRYVQRTMYAAQTEERNKLLALRSQSQGELGLPAGPFAADPMLRMEDLAAPEDGQEAPKSPRRRETQTNAAAVAPTSSAPAGSQGQGAPVTIDTRMLIAESVERLSRSKAEEKHAIYDVDFVKFAIKKPKKKEKPRSSATRPPVALAPQAEQQEAPVDAPNMG